MQKLMIVRCWGCVVCLVLSCAQALFAASPPITALAFTADGQQLVVGSQAGVAVRSWPELKVIRELKTKLPHVCDLKFSPDGKQLAIAGGAPGDWGDIELHTWDDTASDQPLLRCETKAKDTITSLAWSKDGQRLLSASDDKLVRLYDRELKALRSFAGHSRPVTAVAWLPGEQQFVSAGYDQSIRVWQIDQDAPLRSLDQHTGAIFSMDIDLRGRYRWVFIGTCAADKTVRFWQPEIGRMVRFVKLPTAPQLVRWLPDGSHLAVVSSDGMLRLIESDTTKVTRETKATTGWPYALVIHPSGQSAAVGGEQGELRSVQLLKSDEDER